MVKKISQNQVERLLDLVPYLTANQGVALEKIAADFQIDKSTVIEDLNTLWMCGLPGYTPLELIDLSFETGFVSIRNAEVLSKPRKLSSLELATIIVGLSILLESIPISSTHFAPISELLSRLASTSIVPVPASIRSSVNSGARSILEKSMKTGCNVSIAYYSFAKDSESIREIQPFGFHFIDGQEYLDSYCYESKDFRMFRLDRITNVKKMGPSERILKEVENVSSLHYFSVKLSSHFRRAAEVLNIKISSNDSRSEEFESTAFSSEWIVRTICSLNNSARLTKPADLQNEVAVKAAQALALYI